MLVVAALLWLFWARSRREPTEVSAPFTGSPATDTGSAVARAPLPASPAPAAVRVETPSLTGNTLRPPPLELSTGMLPWETQIVEAIKRGSDPKGKAREILALVPRLPEEALATATEQAVERLPDADYAATVLPVLTNPQTHGQVLSVLFADLMERPDAITLPALLTLAQNPAHPFAAPALDNLRLLLRGEFGTDWKKWTNAVENALLAK